MVNTRLTPTQQAPTITVNDCGKTLTLDYAGLEAFHQGDSWWGCTVGFRAMQLVAAELSASFILDRDALTIVSGHPGPGVLDAIEYITKCISTKRFALQDNVSKQDSCSRDMAFEWWVSDGSCSVYVKLRDGFVPESFYEVLDRLGTEDELTQDPQLFNDFKDSLSRQLWEIPLDTAFQITHLDKSIVLGKRPNA